MLSTTVSVPAFASDTTPVRWRAKAQEGAIATSTAVAPNDIFGIVRDHVPAEGYFLGRFSSRPAYFQHCGHRGYHTSVD
jgi:hypothetical protein